MPEWLGKLLRKLELAPPDEDLHRELSAHLELETEEQIEAGYSCEEASYRALRSLGNTTLIVEVTREMWGWMSLERLWQDLRYALRTVRRYPGFATVAVLSMALGIGANTAIFSLLDAVLLKSLPVKSPRQLVLLRHTTARENSDGFPYSSYAQLRDRNQVFAGMLAYSRVPLSVSIDDQIEPVISGQLVSGSYFETLGVGAAVGRMLTPDDDRLPGGHPVCVISYGYWKRRFSGRPDVVGRMIRISGAPFVVVGVTPPEFFGLEVGRSPVISVPLMMQAQVMPGIERLTEKTQLNDWLHVIGRLKPGVAMPQAQASLEVLYGQIVQELVTRFASEGAGFVRYLGEQRIAISPGGQGISDLRRQFSKPLLVLMVFVGLVLLIACANVANLLLARATVRQKEIAVRLAIGAGRTRLIRQLLTESVLLAAMGGAVGLLFAYWGTDGLLALQGAIQVAAPMDARLLAFTFAVSLLTGVVFGIAPAFRAVRLGLGSHSSAQSTLGRLLVVSQVALSVVLLIGAGLLVRSLEKLRSVDAGFRSDHVLLTRLEPAGSDRKTPQLTARYDQLLARVSAIPGVRVASLAGVSPITRGGWAIPGAALISVPGSTAPGADSRVSWTQIFPNSFEALGVPLLAGRDFGPQDSGRFSPQPTDNSHLVAIVNQTMARQFFGDQNPVGKRFGMSGRSPALLEVIGVVKDTKFGSLREKIAPMFFLPFSQANTGRGQMTLEVHIAGDATGIAAAIRREARALDPNALPFAVETLDAQVAASLSQERLIAFLSSLFGGLAWALASVGVYGLMSYNVARRTRELGIRMALGARAGDVLRIVWQDTLALLGLGILIGLPVAMGMGRLLSVLLFGLTPSDPVTLSAAAAIMLVTGTVAGYWPARRASRVDPMVALRYE
jgi:predicted permease